MKKQGDNPLVNNVSSLSTVADFSTVIAAYTAMVKQPNISCHTRSILHWNEKKNVTQTEGENDSHFDTLKKLPLTSHSLCKENICVERSTYEQADKK
jgi:hypothetical protein